MEESVTGPPLQTFAGKRCIVTGGARGIGADLVRGLTASGGRVAVFDRRQELGEALVAEVGHDRSRFFLCDVSDQAAIGSAFGSACNWLGGLDVLICCAGLDKPGFAAEDIPLEAWNLVLDVNAKGTFLANQLACRRMKPDGGGQGGAIINFSSYAGIRGIPERAAYSAAKAAILGWTRAAARSWGQYDITVNAIAPTMNTDVARRYIETLAESERSALVAERNATTPMGGRLGEVEHDLVPLVRMLAGAGGRYITGQTFAVDGGRTMIGS